MREFSQAILYCQSFLFQFPVERIKRSAQNKIIRGKSPGHRIAEHCEITSALRQALMKTVEHMSAHHPQPPTAPLRKSFESFRRRPDPIGVHGENRKRAVLPLDNPVKSRPRCFGNVKKN